MIRKTARRHITKTLFETAMEVYPGITKRPYELRAYELRADHLERLSEAFGSCWKGRASIMKRIHVY